MKKFDNKNKPRIALICDVPNWAFDMIAKEVKRKLAMKNLQNRLWEKVRYNEIKNFQSTKYLNQELIERKMLTFLA